MSNDKLSVEEEIEALRRTAIRFEKTLEAMESRQEQLEQTIAMTMAAYTEMYATLELLMQQVVGKASEEEIQKFMKNYNEIRSKIWQTIAEAGKSGMEGMDPDVKSAMDDILRGNNSTPAAK